MFSFSFAILFLISCTYFRRFVVKSYLRSAWSKQSGYTDKLDGFVNYQSPVSHGRQSPQRIVFVWVKVHNWFSMEEPKLTYFVRSMIKKECFEPEVTWSPLPFMQEPMKRPSVVSTSRGQVNKYLPILAFSPGLPVLVVIEWRHRCGMKQEAVTG